VEYGLTIALVPFIRRYSFFLYCRGISFQKIWSGMNDYRNTAFVLITLIIICPVKYGWEIVDIKLPMFAMLGNT